VPWPFVVLGAAVVALAATAVVHHRFTSAKRLRRLQEAAEPLLGRLRMWRSQTERDVAGAVAIGRWISRDTRDDWLRAAPALSPELIELAGLKRASAETRDLVVFLRDGLPAFVAAANEQIRNSELAARRAFFDSIETKPLTDEQASAVVTFDNRVQVIAAAGSGKTSVMVARAAYAILREFVPAERILLLAFNKDAATELQERVTKRLAAAGISSDGLRASTFHSFGLSVIGEATGIKPRLASWLDGGGDIAMVSRIVDELRDSSPRFRWGWDLYRLLFARMAEEPNAGEPDGYDHDTKETGYRTFAGEVVKSQGERMIADFLFLNGVRYQYEHPYSYPVADAQHSQYRPDFFYPDIDLWHEHWALDHNGTPPVEFRGYAESMAWKKKVHREHGTSLIETTWASILDKSGFQPLADELTARGLTLDWNPDRPTPGTTPLRHEDLARLMRSFLAHVKSNSLTRDDLQRHLGGSAGRVSRYRAQVFLDLFWEIYDEWQKRLAADGSIDFEDMLVLAAEHLEAGHVDMGYDLVLVDEFQDASQARARLTKALVEKPHRYLLAVGDDWQSINRFAGADLSVMTSFEEWFGECQTLRLQTTFRSPQSICDTASAFVSKNPRQLAKHVTSIQPDYGPPVSLVQVARPDQVPGALAAVLDDLAQRVRSGQVDAGPRRRVTVDVLGRYRFDHDAMPHRAAPELEVTFRTVHASKGLEADFVVLPNVSSGTYGFPSEVVDDPVLGLAMTEADPYPYAEERRLFYVALTRARRQVTMIGIRGRESAFVTELLKDKCVEVSPLSTVKAVEACPACGKGTLVVRHQRATGRPFLGCSTFPRCTYTRNL
jgi:DNA helicase-4